MTASAPEQLPALIAPELGPTSLKQRPWGGRRLAEIRGSHIPADAPADAIWGESWEFSTLAGSQSRALGRELSQLLGGPLPFLAKLIDTERALSIQVHPEDDAAAGVVGKEEAWIILDAAPGAAVLVSVREDIDTDELRRRAEAAWRDAEEGGPALVDALERIEVQRGDLILVPGRTVHAIQGGILLAEIQQPSDCTYRVFDYGSERQIHPEQALETIDVHARPKTWIRRDQPQHDQLSGRRVSLRVYTGPDEVELPAPDQPALLVCVDGPVSVEATTQSEALDAGDLRLWTRDALSLRLPKGAQLVVGRVREGEATHS